jgi:transposase
MRRFGSSITRSPSAGETIRACTGCVRFPASAPFIATVLVLELGDIARFAHAKQVASYAGLTPRVRAGADRIRNGHITKGGNR